MNDSEKFIAALQSRDLAALRQIPKADLHNHFVLGGSREYLRQKTGVQILPVAGTLHSMAEMHRWTAENMGARFENGEMRRLLIEAAFVQAQRDGVTVLEIGEDVWALGAYFHNDIEELIDTFESARRRVAPAVELRLQIGLSRHCQVRDLLAWLAPFWGRKEFYSIDLYGDETAQPIENFIPIYQKAGDYGLKRKAHLGEWGTAEDVVRGVQVLGLEEVQHGIAAAASPAAVRYLRDHHIRLNITPSSNVLLGRVGSMAEHPIARLCRAGVPVTVNSDDVLIFDSEVPKEYLILYHHNVLSAQELDAIRREGLQKR